MMEILKGVAVGPGEVWDCLAGFELVSKTNPEVLKAVI